MRITPLRLIALLFVASLLPAKLQAASVVRHQLDAVLPEVKFDGVSLADAIDFLRDVSGKISPSIGKPSKATASAKTRRST